MRKQIHINGYIFREFVLCKKTGTDLSNEPQFNKQSCVEYVKKTVFVCRFLVKRILEVVVGFQVVMCLFQQWIIPSVKNSLIPFSVSTKADSHYVLLLFICV